MGRAGASAVESALDWYTRRRYALLFYSLVATILLGPALRSGRGLVEFFLALNLAAAVLPGATRRGRAWLLALIVVAGICRHAAIGLGYAQWAEAGLVVWTLIAAFAMYRALRFALMGDRIDAEHIHAALSVYLLAGLFWGVAYAALESTFPGSLSGLGDDGRFLLLESMYFSFVTLATLGYGDVLPVGAVARALAITEAIFGQLYLAIMIAGLIGLRISSRMKDG